MEPRRMSQMGDLVALERAWYCSDVGPWVLLAPWARKLE
jgi:hypothetical protein